MGWPATPRSREAQKLFLEGSLAFSQIEQNGMRINVPHVKKQMKRLAQKIKAVEKKLGHYDEVKLWRKRFRTDFNLDSDHQLSHILFDQLKLESPKVTTNGNPSTDQEALDLLTPDAPFLEDILYSRKLKKARGTYLEGLLRETVDGVLHPFFDLHGPKTFRSSSSHINFQNQPARQKDIKKIIRRSFVPTPGNFLGEIDYTGIEVRGAACYHKDPIMLDEISNPKRDMHRDMACECFMLGPDQWNKSIRGVAKNKFVFPQFYGDWWKTCAKGLWNAIDKEGLQTAQGGPLKTHLASKGIKNLARFEKHIEEVEHSFWFDRFAVYSKWKKAHYNKYQKNGYIDSLTGFRYQGVMSRNEVINYPIQGSSFHCLLWAVIRLQKIAIKEKWRTRIIGQIHDAIILDIFPAELEHVLGTAHHVMCVELKRVWPWIIVPIDVEVEVAPQDTSWYDKQEVVLQNGLWIYKETGAYVL